MSKVDAQKAKIQKRREELSKERAQLEEITNEERELAYQEFELDMKEVEELREKAGALEADASQPNTNVKIIVYVGSKVTKVDMSAEAIKRISGLANLRKNTVANLSQFLRQQASGIYQISVAGKQDFLAKYNDKKRKEERAKLAAQKAAEAEKEAKK